MATMNELSDIIFLINEYHEDLSVEVQCKTCDFRSDFWSADLSELYSGLYLI